jgi:hypothetical protein
MEDKIIFYSEIKLSITKLAPGIKTHQQVFKLVKDFRESTFFNYTLFHIVDLRDCYFDFGVEKIEQYIETILYYKNQSKIEKGVYLVNTPGETAIVHLIQEKLPNYLYCSGKSAAFRYLSLGVPYSRFEEIIDG